MLGDVVGYCMIKSGSTTGISAGKISNFEGKPIRVLEFAFDGGVMVVNPEGDAIGTFDKCDITHSFKCEIYSQVVCPPDLPTTDKVIYVAKRLNRKGGYGELIKQMVVRLSLMKGKVEDDFLFQKQAEDESRK